MAGFRAIVLGTLPREALELPGTFIRILEELDARKATWMIIEYQPGTIVPRHRHTQAVEWSYVLSGALTGSDGRVLAAGSAFSVPANTDHGPFIAHSGCTLLVTYLGPLDFIEA